MSDNGKRLGSVVSIALSKKKGTRKAVTREAFLVKNHGLKGDAHAGPWHRQVSILASESIERARAQGLDVQYGDFAENIATVGVDWMEIPPGTVVRIGNLSEIEITQLGKVCHKKCAIYYMAGDCIMPREGVFGRVLKSGPIRCGDPVFVVFQRKNAGGGVNGSQNRRHQTKGRCGKTLRYNSQRTS